MTKLNRLEARWRRAIIIKAATTAVKVDKIDFIAECFYKTVTFSPEDFQKRLEQLNLGATPPSDNFQASPHNSVQPDKKTGKEIVEQNSPDTDIVEQNSPDTKPEDSQSLSSLPSQQVRIGYLIGGEGTNLNPENKSQYDTCVYYTSPCLKGTLSPKYNF